MLILEATTGDEVVLPAGWRPGERRTLDRETAEDLLRRYPDTLTCVGRTAHVAEPPRNASWLEG